MSYNDPIKSEAMLSAILSAVATKKEANKQIVHIIASYTRNLLEDDNPGATDLNTLIAAFYKVSRKTATTIHNFLVNDHLRESGVLKLPFTKKQKEMTVQIGVDAVKLPKALTVKYSDIRRKEMAHVSPETLYFIIGEENLDQFKGKKVEDEASAKPEPTKEELQKKFATRARKIVTELESVKAMQKELALEWPEGLAQVGAKSGEITNLSGLLPIIERLCERPNLSSDEKAIANSLLAMILSVNLSTGSEDAVEKAA